MSILCPLKRRDTSIAYAAETHRPDHPPFTIDSVDIRVTDNWGYQSENGSWNGMVGMLQRREVDLGGTAMFLVKQRIGIIDYVQLYTHTK